MSDYTEDNKGPRGVIIRMVDVDEMIETLEKVREFGAQFVDIIGIIDPKLKRDEVTFAIPENYLRESGSGVDKFSSFLSPQKQLPPAKKEEHNKALSPEVIWELFINGI